MIPDPDTLAFEKLMASMLDKEMFNYEFPCDRLNGKAYDTESPRSGLSSSDIWWKPVRTEIQKAQDRVLRSFMKSCRTGFNGNFVEFGRAYRAGFADLESSLQARIIYSFIAAGYYTKRTLVYADYFLCYV
jgi:hypothetical protein